MWKYLITIIALIISLSSFGCNTMEGLGQDVQKAGEKLEETAEEAAD